MTLFPTPLITVLGLGIQPLTAEAALPAPYQDILASADVIAGGERQLSLIKNTDAERICINAALKDALLLMEERMRHGRRIAVIADGDPLFYGIGATLIRRFGREKVCVMPNVSVLQEACARLGFAWHNVRCCSLHGRTDMRPLYAGIADDAPVCVLTDSAHSVGKIAGHLLERGIGYYRIAVFERLGSEKERISEMGMAEAALRDRDLAPCTFLLLPPEKPPHRRCPGTIDAAFARYRNLMTKRPVRAAALAMLHICRDSTVWDIGAGSGSVAIEASFLARAGEVYAVERDASRADDIRTNRCSFGAVNLAVCTGSAPECLDALPDPDSIFLGGGLGTNEEKAEELLHTLAARLKPGGRIVAACVLIHSLHTVYRIFRQLGWPAEQEMIQAASGHPLADDMHFTSYNPVFLLAAQKPDT